MTTQLALFAPTVLLSQCHPGDTIRFSHQHLALTLLQVEVIGPQQLAGTGVTLTHVVIEETRKCSCSFSLEKE